MMGNPGSLPLPSAPAATQPTPAAGSAATTARPVLAGVPADADAAPDTGADAALLFDLLLGGGAEDAEHALPTLAAAGGKAKPAATGRGGAATEAVDPLAMVLAQMPQLQAASAAPTQPEATPASPGINAGAAVAAMPLPQAAAAAAQPAVPAPAVGIDTLQPPAPAAPSPASAAGAAMIEGDGEAAPFARLALQPETPKPAPLASSVALALAADEGARQLPQALPRNDAAAAPVITPLHAMQPAAGVQPANPAPTPPQAPILQQPADPANGYDDRFGSHVALLAGQRIGQAEIRVVPEHLGAIDIRLKVDGNDVRAEFHSAQPDVRQALEASLPRLREMLGQHGLQLSHAGVGQGQAQGQGGQRQSGDGLPRHGQGEGLNLPHEAGSPLPPDFRRARGLLDVYA
ncbi:flagellar hook-length control protein FliK [Thermomonas brevis]